MNYKIVESPQMKAICFEGMGNECEMEAFRKMKEWLDNHHAVMKYRVFGYNTDSNGKITVDPQHEGYKVLVATEDIPTDFTGIEKEVITQGTFLVIRAEGEMNNIMEWLPDGWMNLNRTVQEYSLKVKEPPRWYEEHIKTASPDYMIVDLHLELQS